MTDPGPRLITYKEAAVEFSTTYGTLYARVKRKIAPLTRHKREGDGRLCIDAEELRADLVLNPPPRSQADGAPELVDTDLPVELTSETRTVGEGGAILPKDIRHWLVEGAGWALGRDLMTTTGKSLRTSVTRAMEIIPDHQRIKTTVILNGKRKPNAILIRLDAIPRYLKLRVTSGPQHDALAHWGASRETEIAVMVAAKAAETAPPLSDASPPPPPEDPPPTAPEQVVVPGIGKLRVKVRNGVALYFQPHVLSILGIEGSDRLAEALQLGWTAAQLLVDDCLASYLTLDNLLLLVGVSESARSVELQEYAVLIDTIVETRGEKGFRVWAKERREAVEQAASPAEPSPVVDPHALPFVDDADGRWYDALTAAHHSKMRAPKHGYKGWVAGLRLQDKRCFPSPTPGAPEVLHLSERGVLYFQGRLHGHPEIHHVAAWVCNQERARRGETGPPRDTSKIEFELVSFTGHPDDARFAGILTAVGDGQVWFLLCGAMSVAGFRPSNYPPRKAEHLRASEKAQVRIPGHRCKQLFISETGAFFIQGRFFGRKAIHEVAAWILWVSAQYKVRLGRELGTYIEAQAGSVSETDKAALEAAFNAHTNGTGSSGPVAPSYGHDPELLEGMLCKVADREPGDVPGTHSVEVHDNRGPFDSVTRTFEPDPVEPETTGEADDEEEPKGSPQWSWWLEKQRRMDAATSDDEVIAIHREFAATRPQILREAICKSGEEGLSEEVLEETHIQLAAAEADKARETPERPERAATGATPGVESGTVPESLEGPIHMTYLSPEQMGLLDTLIPTNDFRSTLWFKFRPFLRAVMGPEIPDWGPIFDTLPRGQGLVCGIDATGSGCLIEHISADGIEWLRAALQPWTEGVATIDQIAGWARQRQDVHTRTWKPRSARGAIDAALETHPIVQEMVEAQPMTTPQGVTPPVSESLEHEINSVQDIRTRVDSDGTWAYKGDVVRLYKTEAGRAECSRRIHALPDGLKAKFSIIKPHPRVPMSAITNYALHVSPGGIYVVTTDSPEPQVGARLEGWARFLVKMPPGKAPGRSREEVAARLNAGFSAQPMTTSREPVIPTFVVGVAEERARLTTQSCCQCLGIGYFKIFRSEDDYAACSCPEGRDVAARMGDYATMSAADLKRALSPEPPPEPEVASVGGFESVTLPNVDATWPEGPTPTPKPKAPILERDDLQKPRCMGCLDRGYYQIPGMEEEYELCSCAQGQALQVHREDRKAASAEAPKDADQTPAVDDAQEPEVAPWTFKELISFDEWGIPTLTFKGASLWLLPHVEAVSGYAPGSLAARVRGEWKGELEAGKHFVKIESEDLRALKNLLNELATSAVGSSFPTLPKRTKCVIGFLEPGMVIVMTLSTKFGKGKAFRRHLAETIIPKLRETGTYSVDGEAEKQAVAPPESMGRAVLELMGQMRASDDRREEREARREERMETQRREDLRLQREDRARQEERAEKRDERAEKRDERLTGLMTSFSSGVETADLRAQLASAKADKVETTIKNVAAHEDEQDVTLDEHGTQIEENKRDIEDVKVVHMDKHRIISNLVLTPPMAHCRVVDSILRFHATYVALSEAQVRGYDPVDQSIHGEVSRYYKEHSEVGAYFKQLRKEYSTKVLQQLFDARGVDAREGARTRNLKLAQAAWDKRAAHPHKTNGRKKRPKKIKTASEYLIEREETVKYVKACLDLFSVPRNFTVAAA